MFFSLSPEITTGNIITAISVLGGWAWFLFSLKSKIELLTQALSVIDRRLTSVENTIGQLNVTAIQIAKQEVRLDNQSSRISKLEESLKR